MSLIDRHNAGDSGYHDGSRVLTFDDFQTLNKQNQTSHIHSLFSKPQQDLFCQSDLNHFVDWIKDEIARPRKFLKKIARDLALHSNADELSSNPEIGQTLTSLYWFGSKREVRKILKDVFKNSNTETLMANPDIHQLVHLAKLARLKSELVRFGTKLISAQDISALRSNKSFKAFLGEMTYAGVYGLDEALEEPPSNLFYLPTTTPPTEPNTSRALVHESATTITARNCVNRPESYLRGSFRPLNFGRNDNIFGRNFGD